MKPIRFFAFLGFLTVTGCHGKINSQVTNDPAVNSFIEAANRFKELQHEGNIPGFDEKDHGVIKSSRIDSSKDAQIQYPQQICMQVEKLSEDGIYWFVFEKTNRNANWEIVEAWKTDARGQNRKDFGGRKGNMEKETNGCVRQPVAQHLRKQNQMVIVHPD